jgi:hypothetical protein
MCFEALFMQLGFGPDELLGVVVRGLDEGIDVLALGVPLMQP